MATSAQTVQNGTPPYGYIDDKLAAIIFLLNTNGMTAEQINAGSVCYQCITDKLSAIIYLLAGASGSSGSGGVVFGNYNGGQPTFTPPSGFGLAVDTSNGTLWQYYGGAWH